MKKKLSEFSRVCAIIAAVAAPVSLSAAPFTSVPTGGLWSNPNTWSPMGVPGPGDDVTIFTVPGFPVTSDITTTVDSLTIQSGGFGAEFVINPSITLSVDGDLLVDGSNTSLEFLGTAGMPSLLDVEGNVTFSNSAVITMNVGNQLNVFGNLTLSGGDFLAGMSTIQMDGDLAQLITGPFNASGTFYNLSIVNGNPTPSPANSVTTSEPIEVSNLLNIFDGAFRSSSTPAQNSIYNDITIETDGNFFLAASGGDVDILGDFTNSDGFYDSQGQVTSFVGMGTQTVLGAFEFDDVVVGLIPPAVPVATNSNVVFTPDALAVQITGTTDINSGSLTSKDDTTFAGTVNIDSGTSFIQEDGSLNIFQSDIVNNGTFDAGTDPTTTVRLSGPNPQSITGSTPFNGMNAFNTLEIAKSSNTAVVSATNSVDADSLLVNRGIYSPPDGSIYGDININGPAVGNFGTLRPEPNAEVTVLRDMARNNNARFRANNSRIVFGGSMNFQEIIGGFVGLNAFFNLEINHTGSTRTVSIPISFPTGNIEIDNELDLIAGELNPIAFGGFESIVFIDVPPTDSPTRGAMTSNASNGTPGGFVGGLIRRSIDNSNGTRLFPVGTPTVLNPPLFPPPAPGIVPTIVTDGQFTPLTMDVIQPNGTPGAFVNVRAFNEEHPPYPTAGGGPNDSNLAHDRHWLVTNGLTPDMADANDTSGMEWNQTLGYDDIENTTNETNQIQAIYNPPDAMAPQDGDSYDTFNTVLDAVSNNAVSPSFSRFGNYTLLEVDDPNVLAVELVSFSASADGFGEPVTITWETAAEYNSAGFNVYLAGKTGPGSKINGAFIPAVGNDLAGSIYTETDTVPLARGEVRSYYLEEIEFSGGKNMYGPVSAKIDRNAHKPGKTSVTTWEMFE